MARQGGGRILWIHQNFVTARQVGNSRAIHLIAALLESGWSVDVVTYDRGYLDTTSSPTAEVGVSREGELSIHRLPSPDSSDAHHRGGSYLRFLASSLVRATRLEAPDLIYCSSPPLPQAVPALLLSVLRGTRLVFEVRDLWPAMPVELGLLRFPPLIFAMETLEALMIRYAHGAVAVTPAFGRYLEEMGSVATLVLPTGGDPALLSLDRSRREAWRKERGWSEKFVVLYSGSLNEHYAVGEMIEAARLSGARDARIVWVLAGDGRERDRVEDAARRIPHLHYLGALPKDQLDPVFASADLGLVSLTPHSLFDAVYPGKLFDYLAAALPVVSTIGGHTGQILAAAHAGRVVEGSGSAALANLVHEMAAMETSELRQLGHQGRHWLDQNLRSDELSRAGARWLRTGVSRGEVGRVRNALRLLFCSCGALTDAATHRSRRVIARLFGARRDETLRESFPVSAEGTRRQDPPLPMPELLRRSRPLSG